MSSLPRPTASASNPGQPRQQTQPPQLISPPRQRARRERPVLTIQIGSDPVQTQTNVLNALATHIFGPDVQREAQKAASTVQTSRSGNAPPASSRNKTERSLPRSLSRLFRPLNPRSSSNLAEQKAQESTKLDDQGSHLRFIEDVRNALPADIDDVVTDSLGPDALRVFSRDSFPKDLMTFLQDHEGVTRQDVYAVLVDVLSSKVRSYTFNEMPIRVIKLPEMVFLERDGVVETLLKKLRKRPTQIFAEISVEDIRALMHRDPSLLHLCETIVQRWLKKEARYTILSHTWEGDELTYKDFLDSEQRTRRSAGYDKLKQFCSLSHKEFGAWYAWADTVCIDKSSSSELDESIRSMFTWYRNSHAGLVYLARTLSLEDMVADRWFTRGWTLQELLAPQLLKFYNKNWKPLTHLLNDKKALGRRPERPPARSYTELFQTILQDINTDTSHLVDADLDATSKEVISRLESAILRATGIPMNDIIDFKPGFQNDLSKRMQWIAHRNTTRAEDKSYCMMGIFGVSMSVAYGEGAERAFFRLFETILRVSSSPDLFLWAGKPIRHDIHASYMIPSSPECFLDLPYPKSDFQWDGQQSLLPPREPITLTNVGISVSILVIPELQLRSYEDPGAALAKTMVLETPLSDDPVKITLLNDEWISFRVYQDGNRAVSGEFAFGACNFSARPEGSRPTVPRRFWAIVVYRRDERERWRRLSTRDVVTFACAERLRYKTLELCGGAEEWKGSDVGSKWTLPGVPQMTLQTLYL